MYYFIAIIQLWHAKTPMANPWRINSPWRILVGPLTLVPPVKIPIFTVLLPRLIARASQPDGNMTSLTLHFSHLT